MKRFATILLAGIMCLGLVACGKDAEEGGLQAAVEYISEGEEAASEESSEEIEAPEKVQEKEDKEVKEDEEKEAPAEASTEDKASEDKSSEEKSDEAKTDKSQDGAAETTEESAPTEVKPEEPAAEPENSAATEKVDYGRLLFTGDSRTVDMFSGTVEEIRGEVHDGIPVYCRDACQFEYMVGAIDEYGLDNFDTLVTWMGCNNYGNFSQYGPYYDDLLAKGKKIVICTVGPTLDGSLANDFDRQYYVNDLQIQYNKALKAWAKGKANVKVIDLYSYISNSSTISISTEDGIHYFPQPTTELWSVILSNVK